MPCHNVHYGQGRSRDRLGAPRRVRASSNPARGAPGERRIIMFELPSVRVAFRVLSGCILPDSAEVGPLLDPLIREAAYVAFLSRVEAKKEAERKHNASLRGPHGYCMFVFMSQN